MSDTDPFSDSISLPADQPVELCEEPGCTRAGFACWYGEEGNDAEPGGVYCGEHAFQNGFCAGCGYFWAGNEQFEFGNGLCPNCASEARDAEEEEDYDYCEELG